MVSLGNILKHDSIFGMMQNVFCGSDLGKVVSHLSKHCLIRRTRIPFDGQIGDAVDDPRR